MLHPHHYETMTPGLSRLSFKFPVHLVLILVSDDRGIYPSLSSLPRQVHLQAPSMLIFNVSYFTVLTTLTMFPLRTFTCGSVIPNFMKVSEQVEVEQLNRSSRHSPQTICRVSRCAAVARGMAYSIAVHAVSRLSCSFISGTAYPVSGPHLKSQHG